MLSPGVHTTTSRRRDGTDGERVTIPLFPTTNSRYGFAVQCAFVYVASAFARHQFTSVPRIVDDALPILVGVWGLTAVMVYRLRFAGGANESQSWPATNLAAFIIASTVMLALVWVADFQWKGGIPGQVIWMLFVTKQYRSRRTTTVSKRELFAGVAAIAGVGFAVSIVVCSLLNRAGMLPHFGFLFGPESIAPAIAAVALFWGGMALLVDWSERTQPLRRARDDAAWAAYVAIPRQPQAVEAQRLGLGLGLQRRR